jgi:4-hydroxy-4-methyl-2-oxoglutarate aldolase
MKSSQCRRRSAPRSSPCSNRPKPRQSATGVIGASAIVAFSRSCGEGAWREQRLPLPFPALGLLRPGDILLVDRLGDDRHACWGGGVTVAAKTAGAKAGVVDGPCTDLEEVEASDFPLWCRGIAPITTRIYDLGGRLNQPVSVGGVVVMPGDAVLCDESGVLVLPPAEAESEARAAIERQARGLATQDRVANGEKLGAISGATAKVLGS